ncbi:MULTISPECIES: hypothetical protein [unclassified Nocardioides]|uniref:hypothetical protein n=1 Tax=unclassified Nocardioides TaxID=2615069 RepID=UPI0009EFC6E0|nr:MULTISPECIES: hypothetical protein [unclassified Nocardioides]GAW47793.1 Hydroxyacylglutathione hydrolase [Nocardioides sp. PD653-B2]GAW56161.1 Hydroxyacylglutathione hydrolase [Nocardioides sp. PD653]
MAREPILEDIDVRGWVAHFLVVHAHEQHPDPHVIQPIEGAGQAQTAKPIAAADPGAARRTREGGLG